MLRGCLAPMGIALDQHGIQGNLLGDKGDEVVEQSQGLLHRKAASQPQEPC